MLDEPVPLPDWSPWLLFAGVDEAPGPEFVPVPSVFVPVDVAPMVGDPPGEIAALGDGLTPAVEAVVGDGKILRVALGEGLGVVLGVGVMGNGVLVATGVGVFVTVGEGVFVTVGDGVFVTVGEGVFVTVGEGVLVLVGGGSNGICAV